MVKLNLGCGFDKRVGYINIDKRADCKPNMVIDLEQEGLKRFQDRSVDEILMKDFLEHLSWRKVRWFLQECHRVLKSGGRILIQVPDFGSIVQKWQDQTDNWRRWPLKSDWEKLSYWIMGAQEYNGGAHRTIFTQDELRKLLEEQGFKVKYVKSDGGTNLLCEARKE